MMGGAEKIIARGRELVEQGRYLEATEILNHLAFAEPGNVAGRELLADAFEQLGYLSESTSTRNVFLQGAFELRSGLPDGVPASPSGPDVIRAMSTEQWLDFIAISVDPRRAESIAPFIVNLVTPDTGETHVVELSNATLTTLRGFGAPDPDLTITVNRSDLNGVMMGITTFDALIAAGKARFEGDRTGFDALRSTLVRFTPNFEIFPGTADRAPAEHGLTSGAQRAGT
jgi:alkyl sulfatase BDS1-like metallo-beta-lactamase superfamily hydrolase